jgi:CheY-like chemotaxis protein
MDKITRILIVDDEAGMCDFLAYYLASQGFQVVTARSGEDALALLEKERFHIILADIMMPSIDGLEMLRLIKRTLPDTIVIMMTAYAPSSAFPNSRIRLATNRRAYSASRRETKPINVSRVHSPDLPPFQWSFAI